MQKRLGQILVEQGLSPELLEQDVNRILGQLNGKSKDIVRSITVDGQSIKDVAARLEMKEGAVRVALHRGLKTLAAIYREVPE